MARGWRCSTYELLPVQNSSAAFLSQANAQGARGFHLVGNFIIGGTTVAIYGKDSSSARYTYALQALTGNAAPESFLVQANGQGQQGYRFFGEYVFTGDVGAGVQEHLREGHDPERHLRLQGAGCDHRG
jgi:hypothetical protein